MNKNLSENSEVSIGDLRFDSDKRQIGALLMIAGICAIFEPLATIAKYIGPDGTTAASDTPLSALIGGLCLVKLGIMAVFIGYNQAVHDWGNKYLTAYLMCFSLTALIPFATNAVNVGRDARDAVGLIPPYYVPTQSDFDFVGAMGILGVCAYSFAFVGAIFSMLFSLFTFQNRKPHDHNSTYYKIHLGLYAAALFVAGLSQLMLGGYIIDKFGGGDMEYGPIIVAMYVVSFPAISVCVGLVQMLNAMWGFARSMGVGVFGPNDFSYQHSIYFGWFLQFVLQIVVQISYLPGDLASHALATMTALSFGLNLMPAYLDYKARTVPEKIEPEYYGSSSKIVANDSEDTSLNAEPIEAVVQDVTV